MTPDTTIYPKTARGLLSQRRPIFSIMGIALVACLLFAGFATAALNDKASTNALSPTNITVLTRSTVFPTPCSSLPSRSAAPTVGDRVTIRTRISRHASQITAPQSSRSYRESAWPGNGSNPQSFYYQEPSFIPAYPAKLVQP